MEQKKGISLIVLIVTIIVMIIIAGAVIISLTETNIIDQAETAVEKHNKSELEAAANMAYSNWLANKHLEGAETPVQNYIRNELIKQGVATWEDFSKWYITPTGKIEEIDQEALTIIVKVDQEHNFAVFTTDYSLFNIDWGNGDTETETSNAVTSLKPGVYEIKITGENVGALDLDEVGAYMTAIKSWGNVGLMEVRSIYTNDVLEYISVPNENSFKELKTIYLVANKLEELPDKLFKNCNNLEMVLLSFPKIKNIPENMFEGIDKSNIYVDISGCTSLESIPDWLK